MYCLFSFFDSYTNLHCAMHILTADWVGRLIAMVQKACTYMWQSRVEFEGYIIAYFDRIGAFEASYRWTSAKGGAHTRFVDAWISNESTKCIWAPPLTEVQRYGTLNAAMRSTYATQSHIHIKLNIQHFNSLYRQCACVGVVRILYSKIYDFPHTCRHFVGQ